MGKKYCGERQCYCSSLKSWFGLNLALKPVNFRDREVLLGCAVVVSSGSCKLMKDIFPALCPVKTERCSGMRFLYVPLSDFSPLSYISSFGRFSCCSAYIFRFLISSHYLWLWPQLIKLLQCVLKLRYVLKLHWNYTCQCFAALMDMRMCLSTVLNWDHASSQMLTLLSQVFKQLSLLCLTID